MIKYFLADVMEMGLCIASSGILFGDKDVYLTQGQVVSSPKSSRRARTSQKT